MVWPAPAPTILAMPSSPPDPDIVRERKCRAPSRAAGERAPMGLGVSSASRLVSHCGPDPDTPGSSRRNGPRRSCRRARLRIGSVVPPTRCAPPARDQIGRRGSLGAYGRRRRPGGPSSGRRPGLLDRLLHRPLIIPALSRGHTGRGAVAGSDTATMPGSGDAGCTRTGFQLPWPFAYPDRARSASSLSVAWAEHRWTSLVLGWLARVWPASPV
ncbi:hypothetical protein OCOJLMKI_3542 [Methylobacterium iners]|uniref:Uncharacterized protein n=1 Tax=Methylobacterium iners TaxID=418707 RepID=A0ABQ4RZQ6_9HYPH|nr:hypothetical protein OCOJLMKI_3542 [Methylobacterium iners]